MLYFIGSENAEKMLEHICYGSYSNRWKICKVITNHSLASDPIRDTRVANNNSVESVLSC